MLGTVAQAVGNRLANHPAPNPHRVLNRKGEVAEKFAWSTPEETRTPMEILLSEGLTFDHNGQASRDRKLSVEGLAQLVNDDLDDEGL